MPFDMFFESHCPSLNEEMANVHFKHSAVTYIYTYIYIHMSVTYITYIFIYIKDHILLG